MDKPNESMKILNMFMHPVFLVKNGVITDVNHAAQQKAVPLNAAVSDLIPDGQLEYGNFTGGCLSLRVVVADIPYLATVIRSDGADVFHLQGEPISDQARIMALVAQQIRQPLSSLMTTADSFFPHPEIQKDPDLTKKAANMNRGLYQLLREVSNLSSASNSERNKLYAGQIRNIPSILDEIMEKAVALASSANRKLLYTGIHENIYCLADEELLERAVYNLISNAIKFSPDNSTIHVKLTKLGARFYLTVQNECAKGINLDHLFSRFLRDPGIEDSRYGLGLGLSLIRQAASAHAGTLLMDQPESNAVRFTLTLAIRQGNTQELSSPIFDFDYLGGRDHALVELSDVLPPEAFININ